MTLILAVYGLATACGAAVISAAIYGQTITNQESSHA